MAGMTRRTFLQILAAGTTWGAATPAWARGERLPLAFSTLGCPKWPWRTVVDVATREGYAALELRGILGELDLPKVPEFGPGTLGATRDDLRARNLTIACLGSSVQLHHREADARTRHLDDGRRFIDLAAQLEAPFVRVFGDKVLPDEPKTTGVARVADGLRALAQHARGSGVEVLVESHGDFTDSPTLRAMLKAAGPGVGLLWDAHHTYVADKESPSDTLAQLGSWVRHTHLKDSVPGEKDRRYVLTGTGEVPVAGAVQALRTAGYKGLYSFEWEKMWHPDIEEPEVAIPHFARVMREYLARPA